MTTAVTPSIPVTLLIIPVREPILTGVAWITPVVTLILHA